MNDKLPYQQQLVEQLIDVYRKDNHRPKNNKFYGAGPSPSIVNRRLRMPKIGNDD